MKKRFQMFKFLQFEIKTSAQVPSIGITKFTFLHIVWKILIPYSRFSSIYKTDLQYVSAHACSTIFKVLEFQHFEIFQNNMFPNDQFFLEVFGVSWCSRRPITFVLGVVDTSAKSDKNMKMMIFLFFLK